MFEDMQNVRVEGCKIDRSEYGWFAVGHLRGFIRIGSEWIEKHRAVIIALKLPSRDEAMHKAAAWKASMAALLHRAA